jgi:hypothetical protein
VVHIERSDIGPGAATKVLMLDPHGSMRPTGLGKTGSSGSWTPRTTSLNEVMTNSPDISVLDL